ncbi:zinc-ribbon domain-containing protein [Micromonospora purpureochromogenes]|uniref:zinc-ribbon domain-containing protein n=1 Tax=Micromonospora purpureochromogenes TaxID=47872 RepID=UPI00363D6F32
MFFIFGLRTSVNRSGVVTAVCRNCGNRAAQVISRRSTKFTLFFIPLIPVRTRYVQQCSFCGAEYGISKDEARSLPVG